MNTPIQQARNLGATSARELRAVGIHTLEDLKAFGWEAAFEKLVLEFPGRVNLNMACALIGAIESEDWREISPQQKADAKSVVLRWRELLRLRI